jgi:hypothetical protein
MGADEEAGTVVLDPGRELVEFAMDSVKQHQAADVGGRAADLKACYATTMFTTSD